MTTDNIFGNDILNGDLTTSLVPELGTENILIDTAPTEISLLDPLNQELSLTEPEIISDEIDFDNNSFNNTASSFNNIAVFNIDPLIAANAEEFQVNGIDVNDTSFAPPQSQLQFQGGFGDYDGGDDVPLEIKDTEGNVVETFKLTGEGQATLYRDEEHQYVFFSGTDETTIVDIDSVSNIKFGDYIGDSLEIETSGSIEGGDIVLNNPDENGLVLNSKGSSTLSGSKYSIIKLDGFSELSAPYSYARGSIDINDLGQVVGVTADSDILLYDSGEIVNLGTSRLPGVPGDINTESVAINDLGQIIGRSTYVIDSKGSPVRSFLYDDGQISSINALGNFGADVSVRVYDINNSGQIVGYANNGLPVGNNNYKALAFVLNENGVSSLEPISQGYVYPKNQLGANWSIAKSINDSGQIAGDASDYTFDSPTSTSYGVLYNSSSPTNLGMFDYDGPGAGGSTAYSLNNLGQVVGYSFSNAGIRPFLYSEGELIDFGISPYAEYSAAVDINDLSQVIGFSEFRSEYSGTITSSGFIYENGNLTGLNRLIPRDSGWIIEQPEAINNKGQIVGFGNKGAFLLDPIKSLDSKVTVSNISTFGDTVVLQGNEITLTGNAITTQGGEITFDGATKVNSNLTIDSSVTEDEVITDGGDITFTGTVDAASAGSGNLRLQAGTGNILFEDTVGGEATFNNINVLGADIVTATADITSDQVIRINATGDIVTQNITSENGRVVFSSEQKSISTLDITSGKEERDNIVLQAGDSVSTRNLSANELGVVRIASGQYLEEDSTVVGDITTESITGKQIRVDSTGNFTATADALAHDGNVVVNAKQNITAENITATNGNVRLISEEKSITTKDIFTIIPEAVTDEEKTRKGNIILEAIEGVTTANLNAPESGVVRITSGKIVENDTETLEDDTILVGDISTQSITGKAVRAVGTGSFTATGDITAYDGRITVAVTNDVNTKNINSLANSINLISTEGAVTVDGDLNSEKGGISIHAANDILTQKIRSFDGVVALSSYDGEITIEDDINAVRGNVTIAAKEGVEVANVTTGVGEVNIGSGKNIVANGNISTNVGYVNLKAGGVLDVKNVTTNDGYISLGADSNVEIQSLATSSGAINLVSATGDVAVAGSINTEGSYVAIEAALEIIASAIEANGGSIDLVANSDFGGVGLIATDPNTTTDVNSTVNENLDNLSPEQGAAFSEIVSDVVYYSRPVGEFLIGALYATVVNNTSEVFEAGQFLLQYPLALTDRDRKYWTQVINNQSTAFKLGVELANAASIVQGIIEIVSGGGTFLGGAALCTVGAGATFGISCAAGAPAMVTGAAISAHGLSLIKNGLENDTDANLIDDLLAPQKMASTGGADGIDGLAKKTGISGDSIKKVYGDVSSNDIELLGNKLDKNLAEHLFNKGDDGSTGSQLVNNVSDTLKKVGNDNVAIESIKSILRKNKNGKLNDSKTETAFSEAADFLGRYEGRVSGDFPTRFADAQGKKGAIQARSEIRTAESILDGDSPLGSNVSKVEGIPTDVSNTGIPTPDYRITDVSGISRLSEIKTPNQALLDTTNNFDRNLKKAVNQVKIKGSKDANAYITMDYSLQPSTNMSRDRIKQYTESILNTSDRQGRKGIEFVEFIEILYKDTAGQSQRLFLQVRNGILEIIN